MSEKRSVSTDALETLGMIHTRQEYRDAIHLAVEPVVAGEHLAPGTDIYLKNGKAFKSVDGFDAVGIVDPFLKQSANINESFWLVVYPRKITSLRHVWSHPDFKDAEPAVEGSDLKNAAYLWIADYARSLGEEPDDYNDGGYVSADELIEYGTEFHDAKEKGQWGNYLIKRGLLEGVSVPEEFWEHLSVYLGRPLNPDHTGNFFSCSC